MSKNNRYSILFFRSAFCFLLLTFTSGVAEAQYYTSAFGKNGTILKTALHNIIQGHLVGTYADLWSDYFVTDNKGGNILWDIYSDIPGGTAPYTYTIGSNQCGTYNSEGDCYNREHVWPSNYFNDDLPMYTDLQQIYPTDGWVNNKHGNLPYGKVNTVTWTSDNGSKTGSSNTYPGSPLGVFEPIDSFKGDIARIYFYMSTRYEGEDAGWLNWEMANGAELTNEAVTLLLTWHHLDPVSQKEIDRNNAAFAIQSNRNPFVDYPQFADCIWGTTDCSSLGIRNAELNNMVSIYPNPATGFIKIETPDSYTISSYALFNITGQNMVSGQLTDQQINLHHLSSGTYMLMLNTDKGVAKKIVIKE